MNKYPNDSDGNTLRKMEETGFDMSTIHKFEFFIDVENEKNANDIVAHLKLNKIGKSFEINFDEGELEKGEEKTEFNKDFWPSWTVYVFVDMKPDYRKIINFQKSINSLSKVFGGFSDGWGICN
jgi:hypothetical protein